jgi:hypothetical protein
MEMTALRRLWPWSKRLDPFEDFYLHAPPADERNLVVNRIRKAPDGSVYPLKAETHSPAVMSQHVKDLGSFFGVDETRIADASRVAHLEADQGQTAAGPAESLPFAVFCLLRAEHHAREAPGIGGQATALKGAFATFQIAAIIREMGFNAVRLVEIDAERAAVECGIGVLDRAGRFEARPFGRKVHVADVILTDLPLQADADRP